MKNVTLKQVILLKQIVICLLIKQINALLCLRKITAHTETDRCITVVEENNCKNYLVKNGVLGLEASAGKLNNLLIGARLLPTKLIAWEGQDFKPYKTTNWQENIVVSISTTEGCCLNRIIDYC